MKRTFLTVMIFLGLAFAGMAAAQGATDKTKAAEAGAAGWLKLVDSGNYAQSWTQASSIFRAAVTSADWEQKLRAVREPLGAVVFRQLKSAEYTTQLPGAPDGEYVVIRYDTSFQHKKSAVETLVPALDKDGQWRVSGYFIK